MQVEDFQENYGTGFVKLFRSFKHWEWYDNSLMVHLFIHLLITANHKEKNWHGIKINRGQLVTSRSKLSKALNTTERKIRTALTNLETTNEVAIKTTNKWTVVTVINYELYQNRDQQTTSKKSNKRPASDQQATTTKEVKEDIKNEKNIINIPFDAFWNLYDHKHDRKKCEGKWSKLTNEDRTNIMTFVPSYLKVTPNKNFRRHPATFLNNRTWENDLPTITKQQNNGQINLDSVIRDAING